jgi:hypothetical protein
MVGRVGEALEALRPGAVGILRLEQGIQGESCRFVDGLVLALQGGVHAHEQAQGGLGCVVVERGQAACFRIGGLDAIGEQRAALGIEFDGIIPTAGAQLAADQAKRGVAGCVEVILVGRGLVSAKERHADRGRARRLDPDHGRRRLAFAFASAQVGAVAPQIAAFGGDVLAEVLGGAAKGVGGVLAQSRIVGSGPTGKQQQ